MDRSFMNITSPLTIIAVFATIIEASALASLPFLNEHSQDLYTWFLVGFPPFLTLLFFVTLNFNSKALYNNPEPEPGSSGSPRQTTYHSTAPSPLDSVVIVLGDAQFCELTRQFLVEPLNQMNKLHQQSSRIIAWNSEEAGNTMISALIKSPA